MALTVTPVDKYGKVHIRRTGGGNNLVVGRAKPSKTMEGYITIHMPIEPYILRVPIDWIKSLEALDG